MGGGGGNTPKKGNMDAWRSDACLITGIVCKAEWTTEKMGSACISNTHTHTQLWNRREASHILGSLWKRKCSATSEPRGAVEPPGTVERKLRPPQGTWLLGRVDNLPLLDRWSWARYSLLRSHLKNIQSLPSPSSLASVSLSWLCLPQWHHHTVKSDWLYRLALWGHSVCYTVHDWWWLPQRPIQEEEKPQPKWKQRSRKP